MKLKTLLLPLTLAFGFTAFGQNNWKLTKDKDGIRVYESEAKNSGIKNIKVECTVDGTCDKMRYILTNVSQYKNWVYSNKTAYLLKQVTPTEYYYYAETSVPWPLSNRDAVVHTRVSQNARSLQVTEMMEPNYLPEKSGKVRVPKALVTWTVTPVTSRTIHIVYVFDAEPGGNIPAWLVNTLSDKGPTESFKKLRELLK